MRRAGGVAALAAAALALAGCESNQHRSARIAAQGTHALAAVGGLRVGAANRAVRVVQTALIDGAGGQQAVAIALRNDGPAQADVPILLQALGSDGRPVYTNATGGLQPSLQRMALVAAGRESWWVDDQVIGAPGRRSLRVRVGGGRAVPHLPVIDVTNVHVGDDSGATALTGTLSNRSGLAQADVPVFAVARKAGRVVAAGRAIVPHLAATTTPVANAFHVFFVGDAAGAKITVTVAPTAGA